ncbi:energy-coupling factor transporter ATPase [uncultured Phascolarctobacterium sp.]|uniref:energy-coupling factor transporter ATPase n=1 Tax=uncultured Phascolarctobacterium sp. TaxID=512296 RepID=UPI0025D69504|nr:energy-coupling factor transporter ATPase [uncultured Phascolarctobacterium sp.]
MQTIIEVKNLTHIYTDSENKEIKALDGINLEIRQGEFVAVIGANGSGKSTLARHFNALQRPSEGACLIEGMDTTVEENLWNIRQHVGMVFQNPDNQIVAAIVEEDVAFGPENIGVPTAEIRTRVDAALAAVGMSDYARHAPHLLSGGQKQRVAIAGVLALEPKCIVLDEPTAMLDPQGRKEIVTTVKKLNREKGITVVYITHYMEEALQADRIIVMGEGKIQMQGTPKEVFSHVRELYTLGLEAPLAAKVADDLRQSGLGLQQGIITNEELAESICR